MTVYYRSRYCHNDGSFDKDAVARQRQAARNLLSSSALCDFRHFVISLAEVGRFNSEISRAELISILERPPYRINRASVDYYLDNVLKDKTRITIGEIDRISEELRSNRWFIL